MKTQNICLTALALLSLTSTLQAAAPVPVEQCQRIPDAVGRAGMMAVLIPAGTGFQSQDSLLMLGGANFPNALPNAKTPQERGAKVFYSDIVLQNPLNGEGHVAGSIPYKVGYGAFAPYKGGMVIAGGCNETGHLANTWAICMVNEKTAAAYPLPSLPKSIAYPAFCVLDNKLYVIGGQERADSTTCLKSTYVLDLASPEQGWKEGRPMPDEGRMLAGAAAMEGRIYVAGGCSLHPDAKGQAERSYLKSVLCYDCVSDSWSRLNEDMPESLVGAANPLPRIGRSIYVLGGDPGEYYRAALEGKAPAQHPGQSKSVYVFRPFQSEWKKDGENSLGVATAPAVEKDGMIYCISGETHPGVRTPLISQSDTTK